jgi:immunity protein 5 of polymorphic toxin system
MTNGEKMLVSIAIEAAKSCLHVFENEYPADDRPRKALEAAEKWLHEPTIENRRLLEKLETQIWRSKEWHGQAGSAAQAYGCAARAARHPVTSAMDAIRCEGYANGINRREYSRKWLYSVLRQNVRAL